MSAENKAAFVALSQLQILTTEVSRADCPAWLGSVSYLLRVILPLLYFQALISLYASLRSSKNLMKLTLRPEWRLWPLASFLGMLDLKTGVIVALLFAVCRWTTNFHHYRVIESTVV